MACPDSSWKTGPVEPISSKLMAAKRGENGGQRVKKQKSKTQLDESNWEKTSKTQFYDWHWEDWKVLGCSQDPDESDHVSNFRLCKAKVVGIRPQSGVSKNYFTIFLPKTALFRQTIEKTTGICHIGIQVSYMAGKLLKMRIFGWKKFWVIPYFVGSVNVLLTWYIYTTLWSWNWSNS